MIQKLVACNGVATVLLCKTGRSEAGRRWGGGAGCRVAEKAFLSPRIRVEGDGERTVVVSIPEPPAACSAAKSPANPHLPPPSLQLMKFDIVEMTGAMTAFCQDGGKRGGGANAYMLAHL